MNRIGKWAFGLASVAAFGACRSYAGGPSYVELGIFVSSSGDTPKALACVTLPVLAGSRIEEDYRVARGIDIEVTATRTEARVRFVGRSGSLAPEEAIDADDLRDGIVTDVFVTADDGVEYHVRLSPECGTGSRDGGSGGRSGAGGSGAGGTSSAGSGGDGGASSGAGGQAIIEPLSVSSMMPTSGAYGTEVVLSGTGFGSEDRPAYSVILGGATELALGPSSTPAVTSWVEGEIRFRFPFPQEGLVSIEGGNEIATAGSFTTTWAPGPAITVSASTSAVASISRAPDHIAFLMDTEPPTLLEHDGVGWTSTVLDLTGVRLDSLRLYALDEELRAFALSNDDPPEIIDLAPDADSGELVATATGITASSEYAVAGGPEGAVVWFRQGDDWSGARATSTGWTADLGPVSDPNPSGADHAAGATSDGSLYIGWSEDTGSFLDDLGAPFFRRLPPGASTFGPETRGGSSIDDYVTSLRLEGRGDGLLIHYCGSDVDPLGLSGREYRCYTALHPSSGEPVLRASKETATTRYTFRQGIVAAARCSESRGIEMVPDLVGESAMTTPSSPDVSVWPCAPVLAAQVDGQGTVQLVVRHGDSLYSPRIRESE